MAQEEQEENKPKELAPAPVAPAEDSSSKVDVVSNDSRFTCGSEVAVAEATGAEASGAAPDATGAGSEAPEAAPDATKAVKEEEADGRRVSSGGPSFSMVDDEHQEDPHAGGKDTPPQPNEKHIVRCGFRGGSIAQFPGNLQYVDEMKDYRGAYLSATRNGDNAERDRIVDHFLARYAFVDDRTKKYLTDEQAREKMYKSLGDPRKDVRSKKKGDKEVRSLRDRKTLAPPETVRSDRHVNEQLMKAALTANKKKSDEKKKSDAKKKPATEPKQPDAKGKHIVRCGFRGGSIAKFDGNLKYVDEMADFRGTYLKAAENSAERKEIVRYFLSRYLFVDHYKDKPIPEKEAENKIHSGLGDQRREIREGRKVNDAINRRLRLFRAAKKEAKSSKSSVKKEAKVEPSFEEEEDDEEDDDDDDGDESDNVPDTDSPDKFGRLVVRCGEHRYRNLPGNRAYFEEMRDLRGDYQAAPPKSKERKWIVDNFLGNYVFVWGPTNKRMSKKEAKEKINISLRDSRKGVRVESEDEDLDFDHSTIATQQTMDFDVQSAEESADDNETPADDDDDSGGGGGGEQVADDDEQSIPDSPDEKNAAKKKIVVRLGQGHTKLPGNIQYLQEMTDYRGVFLETEEDDPERQRMINHFLNKYTFVNDNGKHMSEELARNKIRLSLKDARMPTRKTPYNKKRKR